LVAKLWNKNENLSKILPLIGTLLYPFKVDTFECIDEDAFVNFFLIYIVLSKSIIKMLEYCKMILSKVSFSKELFEKELKKALNELLNQEEVKEFMNWCYNNFNTTYSNILKRYFPNPALF
jgi:hypothetical protein